jgi:hypothetical protein
MIQITDEQLDSARKAIHRSLASNWMSVVDALGGTNDSRLQAEYEALLNELATVSLEAALAVAPEPEETEWEYGLTWVPDVTGDEDKPVAYSGCETEELAWMTGRRLAGAAQTPRVWKRLVRMTARPTPVGNWEEVVPDVD